MHFDEAPGVVLALPIRVTLEAAPDPLGISGSPSSWQVPMKKMPKVIALAAGLAALAALGQAPAQADSASAGVQLLVQYDTGWG
jgi:hypothetical protein